MIKINLPQLSTTIETRGQVTLLDLLRNYDIPIANSCSGEAICGWCKVKITAGLDQLHPPTNDEKELLIKKNFNSAERLACQIWIESDMTIETEYW